MIYFFIVIFHDILWPGYVKLRLWPQFSVSGHQNMICYHMLQHAWQKLALQDHRKLNHLQDSQKSSPFCKMSPIGVNTVFKFFVCFLVLLFLILYSYLMICFSILVYILISITKQKHTYWQLYNLGRWFLTIWDMAQE